MPLNGEYLPSTLPWAREQAEQYESSGGAEANTLKGVPIIVLTTVGAKSGALRKTALIRVEHEGSYAVVASKHGGPVPPHWYWNLVKHPHVELQDGAVKRDSMAREVRGDERAEWWTRATAVWPDFDVYQATTDRLIQVFVIEPIKP